jgi:hypothetical protein
VVGTRGLTLAALAAAAGGAAAVPSQSGQPAPAGERRAVETTVRSAVYAAVRHSNFRRACRFATPRGRQRLLDGFNSSSGPDYPDCPAIIASEVRAYPETVRRLRRGLVISNVRVDGRRARVRVADGTGPFAGRGKLALVKVDGRWRIDNSNLIPHGD